MKRPDKLATELYFGPVLAPALLNTLLQATGYMFLHNLLNVLVQIANKMGLQKKVLARLETKISLEI
jgi:hypothetical protein